MILLLLASKSDLWHIEGVELCFKGQGLISQSIGNMVFLLLW